MIPKISVPFLTLLCIAPSLSTALGDSHTIHTTATNNSRVAFVAETMLSWETVENDSLRYTRRLKEFDLLVKPESVARDCLRFNCFRRSTKHLTVH